MKLDIFFVLKGHTFIFSFNYAEGSSFDDAYDISCNTVWSRLVREFMPGKFIKQTYEWLLGHYSAIAKVIYAKMAEQKGLI